MRQKGLQMSCFGIRALCLAALLPLAALANAKEYVVFQKNKAFSEKKLTVKVGDSVRFTNQDSMTHNVFSLSDAKTFDLGAYDQGDSKVVTFDKPGTVLVECAVHPDMKMTIEVTK